jgi:Domain of unknown function (DUF4389)
MEQQTKTNLLNKETWLRLLYMAVFGLLSIVARIVVWVVAVLQFLLVLITGEGNSNLRDLGQGASKWTYQAYMFITFNSDNKPFPFSDWPEIDQQEGVAETSDTVEAAESEDADDVPAFVDADDDKTTSDTKG